VEQDVRRDSEPSVDVQVPGRFTAPSVPDVSRVDDVLVRKEYKEVEAFEGYKTTQSAVVVVGHPGIGIFLAFFSERTC
jgi:hypothetical protein